MRKASIRILSTRPVDPNLVAEAAGQGIALEALSFIETRMIRDEEKSKKIAALSHRSITAVFTSMNAVDAVSWHLGHAGDQPGANAGDRDRVALPWKIFCIGSATRQRVLEDLGEGLIEGTADSAGMLAGEILAKASLKEVVFFCGDQRRDELPEKLAAGGIQVQELEVYATIRTPHRIEQGYEGIVFFSPSAVHSFFSNNSLPPEIRLFAIGKTTASAIRDYCGNEIDLSGSPDKEALIRQAIETFKGTNPI